MDMIEQLSVTLADRVAAAAGAVVSVATGRRPASGILWRPDVVVASEQMLPEDAKALQVRHAGRAFNATLAGRDPGTNVAVLKLDAPLPDTTLPGPAETPRVGSLTLVVGADDAGAATARLAMVHAVGDAWHSMAGGRIDSLIRLDTRLGSDEGGPVLSPSGELIGMSTAGPRRRTLVIPTATLARIIDPLLAQGSIPRGWLGVGLQPVMVPESLRQAAGRDSGLMVVGLGSAGPAEAAGVLPGDIMLDLDDTPITRLRALSHLLGAERIGQAVTLRMLRAGETHTITVTVGARPR
ncbi:MAG TPA: S1C family serine protease [Rhodopila sp.]|nr:S1C family serine protease [Rhodopila sp.]